MQKIPTIPVEEAIRITGNWRSFYAEIYNDSAESQKKIDPDGKEVFRGFRIPIEDLEQILEVTKKFNADNIEKISSVRAYLVKDSEDPKQLGDIHIILVPVVGGKAMEPFPGETAAPFGRDLLQIEDREERVTQSVIYDFTSPCPSECDTESPLYPAKS